VQSGVWDGLRATTWRDKLFPKGLCCCQPDISSIIVPFGELLTSKNGG